MYYVYCRLKHINPQHDYKVFYHITMYKSLYCRIVRKLNMMLSYIAPANCLLASLMFSYSSSLLAGICDYISEYTLIFFINSHVLIFYQFILYF